jgi:hypothetical protein
MLPSSIGLKKAKGTSPLAMMVGFKLGSAGYKKEALLREQKT